MRAVKKARLGAILAAGLLAGGCTYNYNYRVERPPQPETATPAARCSLVWSGVVPSGWTVRELRGFVDTIPNSGCPAVELKVHRRGLPVDWDSSLGAESSDWIVRSALTQYAEMGKGPLRRIDAFAEPAEPATSDSTTGNGNNRSPQDDGGNDSGSKKQDGSPSTGGPKDGDPPDTPGPVTPEVPQPPGPNPPATPPGPNGPPAGEPTEAEPAGARGPAPGPSAWVARNAAPALVGGGVVYGLVYLNLLGVPAAGRVAPAGSAGPMRQRGGRREDEAEEAVAAALGGAPREVDRRVRIRSSGFDGAPA